MKRYILFTSICNSDPYLPFDVEAEWQSNLYNIKPACKI